jgi:hypothetical protein
MAQASVREQDPTPPATLRAAGDPPRKGEGKRCVDLGQAVMKVT